MDVDDLNTSIIVDLNEIAYQKLQAYLFSKQDCAAWREVYLLLGRQFSIQKRQVRGLVRLIRVAHPEIGSSKRGVYLISSSGSI